MFVDTYTTIHSILSLLALALGFVVLLDTFGMRIASLITGLFLLLAFLTSATGFGFHIQWDLAVARGRRARADRIRCGGLWALCGAVSWHLAGSIYVIGIVATSSRFRRRRSGLRQDSGADALAPTQSEFHPSPSPDGRCCC